MRIISGIYKSRILISPPSNKVRPTSDRAKETLFNILKSRIDLQNINCLDLFCGTGNLGLESISRGAKNCYFVDRDTTLVQRNINQLKAIDKCKVYKMEAITFLDKFNEEKFDLTFCDPPYSYEHYNILIEKILNLKTNLVLEHSVKLKINNDFEKFVYLKKRIGTVNFTFFDFSK